MTLLIYTKFFVLATFLWSFSGDRDYWFHLYPGSQVCCLYAVLFCQAYVVCRLRYVCISFESCFGPFSAYFDRVNTENTQVRCMPFGARSNSVWYAVCMLYFHVVGARVLFVYYFVCRFIFPVRRVFTDANAFVLRKVKSPHGAN